MHELSIARGIVEVAAEAVREAGAVKVSVVRVRVGALAGVASEALAFSYEVVARGSPLDGSRLVVETVPVLVHCPRCGRDVVPPDLCRLACPLCGAPTADVRGGRELEVDCVEVT
jgi:hydrogenase nickel incorporation protein HypA/HybF